MDKEKVYNEAVGGDEGFAAGDGYPSCDGEPCAIVSASAELSSVTLAHGSPSQEGYPSPAAKPSSPPTASL